MILVAIYIFCLGHSNPHVKYLTSYSSFNSIISVRLEQGTVTSLLEENGTIKGVLYKNKSGEESKAYAPLTVVCDGCFSNLRRSLCSPKVKIYVSFM